MRMTALKCPLCGQPQHLTVIRFGPIFSCASCGTGLRVPYTHRRNMGFLTLAISAVTVFMAGARSWWLLLLTVTAFVPIGMVLSVFPRYVFPPTLEVVGQDSWRPLGDD